MKWIWEKRVEGYFAVPQIATFIEGWNGWKADLSTKTPAHAEVFVRELVQNFMDAARAQQAIEGGVPHLKFQFLELVGGEANRLFEHLDLQALETRYRSFDEDRLLELRLSDEGLTLSGKARKRLPLLIVTESGTTGMYGEWDRTSSPGVAMKMRDALLATNRGIAGAGLGSYGEGKKAVIGVSAPRCLFAYTRFNPKTNKLGVSSRFFGGVYWQEHEFEDTIFGGFAGMGGVDSNSSRPRPLDDDDAHEAVESFSLEAFKVREKNDLGTTYVFVEPTITPEQVAESLMRNWWPAIHKGDATFEIIDAQGETIVLPDLDEIKPFTEVFAETESRYVKWSSPDAVNSKPAIHVETLTMPGVERLGTLKLGVDFRPTVGWSRLEPEKNMSIVALVREGMLISYQPFPRTGRLKSPFVRGVFEVRKDLEPAAEKLLRSLEPPLHNKWQDRNPNLRSEAKAVGAKVYELINARVNEFHAAQLEEEKKREIDLELFTEAFSVTGTRKLVDPPPPPPPTSTPWSLLNESAAVKDAGNGLREAYANRTIQLASNFPSPHEVEMRIGWEVLEDGKWVEATHLLGGDAPTEPQGFTRSSVNDWTFTGLVTSTATHVTWTTRPYRELWTLRPYMNVQSFIMQTSSGADNE
jgi:hypothetical protein